MDCLQFHYGSDSDWCLCIGRFSLYRYGYDRIKRLLHRQKLARMVLENKWYEAENTKDSGFFTDLQSRSREKNRVVSENLLPDGQWIAPYPV